MAQGLFKPRLFAVLFALIAHFRLYLGDNLFNTGLFWLKFNPFLVELPILVQFDNLLASQLQSNEWQYQEQSRQQDNGQGSIGRSFRDLLDGHSNRYRTNPENWGNSDPHYAGRYPPGPPSPDPDPDPPYPGFRSHRRPSGDVEGIAEAGFSNI